MYRLFTLFFTLLPLLGVARKNDVFTDDVLIEHLKKNKYSIDSEANAIVLFESGESSIEELQYYYYKRDKVRRIIKILNPEGLSQADIIIPHYVLGNRAGVNKIEARTYNLESGEITIDELDDKAVTDDLYGNGYKLLKFSLPSVEPGSIIEFTYDIYEPLSIMFADWYFQDDIPSLYSQFEAVYTDDFMLMASTKSKLTFQQVDINDLKKQADSSIPDAYTSKVYNVGNITRMRWVRKNIKPLKEEAFNYNIENYREQVELYIAKSKFSFDDIHSWEGLNSRMYLRYKSFLNMSGGKTEVQNILKMLSKEYPDDSKYDFARRIYHYVQDNFTVTKKYALDARSALREVLREKKGNGCEVNLLLVKLYKEAGYESDIVILGTRGLLRVNSEFPMIDRLNYSVCRVKIDSNEYYLDGNKKTIGFGVLSPSCYNGHAWLVKKEKGEKVYLSPDAIKESQSIVITTENNALDSYTLNVMHIYGDVLSPMLRERWSEDSGKIREALIKTLKPLSTYFDLKSYEVTNLNDRDEPLKLIYKLKMTWPDEKNILLPPSVITYYSENPFKSSERELPVEMPFAVDIRYMLFLDLPTGYTVEELPESSRFKLDDNNFYEYVLGYEKQNNKLMLNSRLLIENTYYDSQYYNALKMFFDKIIEQQDQPCLLTNELNE